MKLVLLLLPIFSADAESKEDKLKSIFSAYHQGKLDRTNRNSSWHDLFIVTPKKSSFNIDSHKKFVNRTEGFIALVSESLNKARDAIKQEAKLLSNEINYFKESWYPTTGEHELKPTETDFSSIWDIQKTRKSSLALSEMKFNQSGIAKNSGGLNSQETKFQEKSSSYDSLGLQIPDYVYDEDRTNEFLIDGQDSNKFDSVISKKDVPSESIEYANDFLNSDVTKLNFDSNGLPIEKIDDGDDNLNRVVNNEKSTPDILFSDSNSKNLGLLNVTTTKEPITTTESTTVTDITTTTMDASQVKTTNLSTTFESTTTILQTSKCICENGVSNRQCKKPNLFSCSFCNPGFEKLLLNQGSFNASFCVEITMSVNSTTSMPVKTTSKYRNLSADDENLTEIDITHNDEKDSLVVDGDYLLSDEQLQQAIDTTTRSSTTTGWS